MSVVMKKISNIALILELSVVGGIGGKLMNDHVYSMDKTANVDRSKFLKNIFNDPLLLPISKDAIPVIIDQKFSQKQKDCIAKSIQELDIDLTGINYKVVLNNEKTDENCIKINRTYIEDYSILAETKFNAFASTINYPINIDVSIDKFMRETVENNDFAQKVCSTVIKHEMLHTLGLCDLYEGKYETKSIMYYMLTLNSCDDLSDSDKYIINTVYNSKDQGYSVASNVQLPKYTYVSSEQKTEDIESQM